jgi:ATP-binding cassette subfamily C protein CydC
MKITIILLGILVSLLALWANISLLALSGWFISAAAFASLSFAAASQFNYFLPAAGVRFLSLARILLRYVDRLGSHDLTLKFLSKIRWWIYEKLEPLAPAHLLNFQSGDLLTRFSQDVDVLDYFYLRLFLPVSVFFLTSILGFVILNHFSFEIAWHALVLLWVSGFIMPIMIAYFLKAQSKRLAVSQADFKKDVVEFCQNLTEIIMFSKINVFIEKLKNQDRAALKIQSKLISWEAISAFALFLLTGVTLWVTLWVAVPLVHDHLLNGAFLAFLILGIAALFESVAGLPSAFYYASKTLESARRITEIAKQKPTVIFTEHSDIQIKNHDVVYSNVSFAYDVNHPVLHNINVAFKSGEKIAITGKSGAGKTTLFHLLERYWDVAEGEISVGGINVKNFNEKQLRSLLSFTPQYTHVFNETVLENICFSNTNIAPEKISLALRTVMLEDTVNNFPDGLQQWLGATGIQLSGGEQKRIGIVRALLHDAPIILLDEPTEGLDFIMAEKMIEQLLLNYADKTIVVITHDPRIAGMMERTIVL